MDKSEKSKISSIRKLEKVCKYWFLSNLKSGITPHVMGCLPDPVKAEMDYCMKMGVSQNVVESTVDKSWQRVYQQYKK